MLHKMQLIITKGERRTKEPFSIQWATKVHKSITKGIGLNVCNTDLMHFLKENLELLGEELEIVLVHWRSQLGDGQVLVECV